MGEKKLKSSLWGTPPSPIVKVASLGTLLVARRECGAFRHFDGGRSRVGDKKTPERRDEEKRKEQAIEEPQPKDERASA